MDIAVLIFLSSGLFLGWSLGANDASNVFGTAVASKMITFTTAAVICTVFVILGAVFSGAGAAHGLGALGSLNTLPGAFMAAFSAALTVLWMTRLGLPVSTTQAVVGAIIGWNFFSGSITDVAVLSKIVATWIACPLLGALFGAVLYKLMVAVVYKSKVHLLSLDSYTRWGLILAGAFGSYSLGANNIGNVMGVFVSSSPFTDIDIGDLYTVSSVQQLFLVGALAIGVGVFTYSKKVMMTVGNSLMPLSAQGAWVVVVAHSLVLFLFSSVGLEHFLSSSGLPTIPLIPVSSSQAVVGAVIGIGLLQGKKGIRSVRWKVLLNIASGWVTTPIISAVMCFFMLFVLQNVFDQKVYAQTYYRLSPAVLEHLQQAGIEVDDLESLSGDTIASGKAFQQALQADGKISAEALTLISKSAEIYRTEIDPLALEKLKQHNRGYLDDAQISAIESIAGKTFSYKWQLDEALASAASSWQLKEKTKVNKIYNSEVEARLSAVREAFHVHDSP
jgi:PiT family inorganic phosphate transporter